MRDLSNYGPIFGNDEILIVYQNTNYSYFGDRYCLPDGVKYESKEAKS